MCAFPAALSVRRPPPSRPVSTVCSLCLHGHCCPADRLIRAIFLDSRPSALWQPREVGWVGGGREVQEGWDICVPVAESCWCMAETTTTVQSNYPPIKKKRLSILMAEISVHRGECLAHLPIPSGRSWGSAPSLALRVNPEPRLPPPPPHLGLCVLLHPWCPVKIDLPVAHEPHVLVLRQSSQWSDWTCGCWSLRPQVPILTGCSQGELWPPALWETPICRKGF